MKRIFSLIAAVLLAGVLHAGAQAIDAFPRTTRILPTDLFLAQTNSAGAAGQKFTRSIEASNILESFMGFPNWTGGGGGTGEVTTAQLNTSSNAIVTLETTRNAAVSNALAALLVVNDNATSNALYSAIISGGITAVTATNIATYVADARQQGSALLSNIVASATNTVFLNISSNLPAAISNVANNTRIRLAGGTYTITPSKVLSNGIGAINLFNKSNIILESEEGAILDGSGALGELLYATNINGLVIRGITFKGLVVTNYTLVSAIGHVHGTLGLYDVQHVTIENCRFIDGHDHGIYDLGSQPNWNNTSTNNIRIMNNYFTNFGSKRTNEAVVVDGTAVVPTAGWWIQGNEFVANLRDIEPYIEGDATSNLGYGVMIIGNRFRNTIENSILSAGATNSQFTTIAGNYFERDVGFQRRGSNIISSAAFIYWNGSHGWRIVGNDFRGQTYAGIWALAGVRDGIISGNRFFDLTNSLATGGLGIQLETVYNFSVTDNDIRRSEAQSIYVYGARDSEVSRNTIVDPAGEVGIQIATFSANVSSNITFAGNRIIGADTPFWDQGLAGSLSLRFYGNEAPGSSDLSNLTVDTITWDTTGGTNRVATIGNLNVASNALYSAIGSGGSGSGTNNPVLTAGPTIAIIANQTARGQFATNASYGWTHTGASNQSSIIDFEFGNLATNTIYNTNLVGFYDVDLGSNVTVLPLPPLSKTHLRMWLNRSNEWVGEVRTAGYALEFANGSTATNHTSKTVTYTAPTGGGGSGTTNMNSANITNALRFGQTNIVVATTGVHLLDLSQFNLFTVKLLTNATLRFTNVYEGLADARVLIQQDTNGQRTVDWSVAGGLIQTNASLQPTTNANALDLLEVCASMFPTNLLAFWPQNFQSRVAFTNSLDSGVLACNTAGQSFMTINGVTASAADYYASGFVSDGQGICKVALNLAVNASETASFFVELRSAAATNSPSQTVLGTSTTVTAAAIGTATNYVTFSFPSEISTSNGSTNWWVVRKTSASAFGLNFGRASGSVNLMKSSADGIAWADVSTTRQGNYQTWKP